MSLIKTDDRNGWENLSGGLENIGISSINSFAWNNDMLWAVINKNNNTTSSLMYYLPSSGWIVADEAIKIKVCI